MFWNDPHLHGTAYPFKEFGLQQFPFAPPPLVPFANLPPREFATQQIPFPSQQIPFMPPLTPMASIPFKEFGPQQIPYMQPPVAPFANLPFQEFGAQQLPYAPKFVPPPYAFTPTPYMFPMTQFSPYTPQSAMPQFIPPLGLNPYLLPYNMNVPFYSAFRPFIW